MPARNIERLDLNLIRPLDALLEHGSVSQAAVTLGMSQPGMSKALGRLRTQLGDPLLVRVQGRMELTEHAEALRHQVRDILGRLDSLVCSQGTLDLERLERTYLIGTPDYAEALVVPPLLERIAKSAPKVKLRIMPLAANSSSRLELGELDCLLALPLERDGPLKMRRLFKERFACVVRKGHPRVKAQISLDQYCELSHLLLMVTPDGPVSSPIDEELAERGRSRNIALTINGFFAAAPILARTDLIATLPERVARVAAQLYPLKVLAPPLKMTGFELCLLWHARRDKDADHRWLRKQIVEACRDVET